MIPWISVVTLVLLAGVVMLGLAWLWSRTRPSGLHDGFRLLSERFESLQRQLLMAQTEHDRSQDAKATSFRSEVAAELQANRRELQLGLLGHVQSLEQKMVSMDQKLERRLLDMSHGVQGKLEQNLKEGFHHFTQMEASLRQTELQLKELNDVGSAIHDLNNLLKLPHLRGNFGEAVLERLLADLLPVSGYELQYRIVPHSTERVDAVIKYPKAVLPIDSKFPREQVLPLFDAKSEAELEEARRSLAEVMKTLSRQIREKYIRPEYGTTDMALLFVPSETLYFEVLRDPKLCEELGRNKVFAVSPNTLAVTLNAVAIARNYYEMAQGVEKTVAEIKKAQSHFEHFERRFEEVGSCLARAQSAFQTASHHLSRYTGSVIRLTGEDPNASEIAPRHDQLS